MKKARMKLSTNTWICWRKSEYCFDPIKDVRGIVLETFQGWGALFYPQSYIDAIDFTKSSDTLVCFDEMQAGFGRTGKLFDTNTTIFSQI